ncbi:MAG: MerR family transcriptional regulator [bacterium]|nr:MerR family transcriptional regulator [bacterium]
MPNALGTKLYYSIGEVAELTELAPYTLRAWESEFVCLRPKRVRGKNRAYRERDIAIILLIRRLLHEERYSTRGAQQRLRNEPELIRGAIAYVARMVAVDPPSLEELTAAGLGQEIVQESPRLPRPDVQVQAAAVDSIDASASSAPDRALLKAVRKELGEILQILR